MKIFTDHVQASPQLMKFLNKKKILHYIQENHGQSRTAISKALSISKPTISKLVDELLTEGWIREKESLTASSQGGRRPFEIYFNKDSKFMIAVDIGGTSVTLAIINVSGDIKYSTSLNTQENLANDLTQTIAKHALDLINSSGLNNNQILGMGIGVPGITDMTLGIVVDAPSLSWKQYPLQRNMQSLLPFPVYIDNDVNVAVLGEQWKGSGKDKSNILLITLGTGVGCGMIINKQLYRGASFAAGEIGYLVTDKHAAETSYDSSFSGYGFLDNHIGGPSITRRMMKHLDNQHVNAEEWPAKRIFEMATNGHSRAIEVIDDVISHLAFACINIVSIMNPECIILGGGISNSLHSYLPQLHEIIEKQLPINTEITITTLENVSLLGAAFLVLKEHDSILKI